MKIVGYLLLIFLPILGHALVPLEGIVLGGVKKDLQFDPLTLIMEPPKAMDSSSSAQQLALYLAHYQEGVNLQESCQFITPPKYDSSWKEDQARRAVVATVQYIGLDTTSRAIGAYAKKLEIDQEQYSKLVDHLVGNFCSENITVYSKKLIKDNLQSLYETPDLTAIPSVLQSPYISEEVKTLAESKTAREKEFFYLLKSFRSLCSWGGEVKNYRMLPPYLKSPFVMDRIIKSMTGQKIVWDKKQKKAYVQEGFKPLRAACQDLVCRRYDDDSSFKNNFPSMIGTTSLQSDLKHMYCHHFRYVDYQTQNQISPVKEWIKETELEDPIFEVAAYNSILSTVPDFMFSYSTYKELPLVLKATIDQRWKNWAQTSLDSFSSDLLFEESLQFKVRPIKNARDIRKDGFKLGLDVTLGELDRILDVTDKLSFRFNLKLSKSYLRYLKQKQIDYRREIDLEGMKLFEEQVSEYLKAQVNLKEKKLLHQMWSPELSRVLAIELMGQVNLYHGPLFDDLKDEMMTIPVDFYLGTFALNYIRFKADVKAGRVQLDL
ncbi:MAG: hypothetical protein ACOVP4_01245 [Bacteriovoracaceae bacterium]